ncbi:MAG TPA: hypothetical protein VFE50_11955 [Cyclobacteriaceae bacterium]|nr:hypothetical protein [Cyclobacteriaceae bacterium]
METSYVLISYVIYLPLTILLTWYVAHTLFKNGRIFMIDIFHGKTEIAMSTNKLFEVGFYLLNVGFALRILETYTEITSFRHVIEVLSSKVGGFSIYLGVLLFLNVFLFLKGRKAARLNAKAPVPPPGPIAG